MTERDVLLETSGGWMLDKRSRSFLEWGSSAEKVEIKEAVKRIAQTYNVAKHEVHMDRDSLGWGARGKRGYITT